MSLETFLPSLLIPPRLGSFAGYLGTFFDEFFDAGLAALQAGRKLVLTQKWGRESGYFLQRLHGYAYVAKISVATLFRQPEVLCQ